MGYIGQNYGIYWAKTIGYIMGYIWQTWDIFGKNYEIYWAKTIGYLVGYIGPKVWDILGKNYGIYYGIY